MDRIKIKKQPSRPIKIQAPKKTEASALASKPALFASLPEKKNSVRTEAYVHGVLVALIFSLVLASLVFSYLPNFTQLNLVLNLFMHWFLALFFGCFATFILFLASNQHGLGGLFLGGSVGGIGILFGYLIRANQNNLSYGELFYMQRLPLCVGLTSCFLGAAIIFQRTRVSFVEIPEEIQAGMTNDLSTPSRLKLAPKKAKKKHRKFRGDLSTKTKIDPNAIGHICPICYDESDLITNSSRNFVECDVCGARHHRDCWESNGGCGTLSEH